MTASQYILFLHRIMDTCECLPKRVLVFWLGQNLALEEWASGRKNEIRDPLEMILLAHQELDGNQDRNDGTTERKIANSSIQLNRVQRTDMAWMLIDDNSGANNTLNECLEKK